METKLDVIRAYISASFLMMGGGFLAFIPTCAIYLFGYWVLFRQGATSQQDEECAQAGSAAL